VGPAEAVLRRDADIAAVNLHSCAESSSGDLLHGLEMAAVLPRPDVRYMACTTYRGVGLNHLAPDARVGVSTALGSAQLRHWRPSLTVELLDGEPESWLGRVRLGDLDAIMFDYLHRPKPGSRLSPSPVPATIPSSSGLQAVPDTHSGLVGVLCRRSASQPAARHIDGVLVRLGEHLRDFTAFAAYITEQACLTRLRDISVDLGDVAVHADINDGAVDLVAIATHATVSSPVYTVCQTGLVQRARELADAVADALYEELHAGTVIALPSLVPSRTSSNCIRRPFGLTTTTAQGGMSGGDIR
jgi:porphobilinogen deaminase